MPRTTPFHPRTSERCRSFLWKEWNGFAAVRSYDAHSEEEYFAVRHKAGVIDVSPLCKVDLAGPDAALLVSRVFTRNPAVLGERRVAYGLLCDPLGKVLDDGTCARIGPDRFRLCTSERWGGWLHRFARGLDVRIEDTTEALAALAVQGPLSRACLTPLVDFDLARMPFFGVRPARIAGAEGWVSRTGFTGDLGYEVFVPAERAVEVWDALFEAGARFQLAPFGLDALDVLRIEAGFLIQGVDYLTARTAPVEARKSTPDELGLGGCVDLEDRLVPFVGQEAVAAERGRGAAWDLVGLELDWAELDALYQSYGLPPHLAPASCRIPVPVYAADGRSQVGQVTSQTWSPLLKRYLALATVRRASATEGTALRVEHTVAFERRSVRARVVPRTFFDPSRMRALDRRPQPAGPRAEARTALPVGAAVAAEAV